MNTRFFEFAKSIASMSDFEKFNIGCVVVYKKAIIGVGFNCNKTHPLQKEYNKLRFDSDSTPQKLHAEMHALLPIRHMDIDWKKVKVYVYRLKKEGMGLARPCISCMSYIKNLGIKHIYYSTDYGYAHEVLTS